MMKRLVSSAMLVLVSLTATASAQNTNSSQTVRPRTTTTNSNSKPATDAQKSTDVQKPATTTTAAAKPTPAKPRVAATQKPGSQSVREAFDSLIEGIRSADVKAVTSVYLNSPRLTLFNSNGTVTKGWEQLRRNRESSYRDVKDVKLDLRDVAITMLGRDGAVVSCLWTQSQVFRGTPETASGRMTLVFQRVSNAWKAIHLHTSPDRPDPSRVMPSEHTTASPASTP